MASKAQVGRSSVFSIGTPGGSPTYTPVGEVKSSGITGAQWGTTDVTNYDSGVDQEFITTVRNNGSLKLDGNRVSSDAGQIMVETAFSTGAITPFELKLPKSSGQTSAGDTFTFNALVESRDFTVGVSEVINYSVTLKISGPVTFTAGS
ncbi:MAG TPA: phage tail tube protein [Edaphobacter sp.]|nr:phage tail tube protein [Edaphobacter sp.]